MAQDPGDMPINRTQHNHSYHDVCTPECGITELGVNPDPIKHSWHPGSVEQQRAHFRPETGHDMKRRPVREGPDYASGVDAESVSLNFVIDLQMPADLITPRMQWILEQVVVGVLGEFVRSNLQYGDTDMSLGYQGQFAELFHIVAKLKRTMWDNNYAGLSTGGARSQIQRELESLIGHALLALDLLDKENKHGKA